VLALVVAAFFLEDSFDSALYHPIALAFGVHRTAPNTLGRASYGIEMLVRLLWFSGLWTAVCATLGRSARNFPLRDKRLFRHLMIGLATGLAVMLATMLGIWGIGAASVSQSGHSFAASLLNGTSWLFLDLLGAFGEELYGRAVILVVTERFLGWKGAVVVSGVMFSGIHLTNPGSTWVWLLRLFLQGVVLAYAVFRTRSLWWSVGYHTGWNWVSAPLFGAAGSGYLDEGHIFDFFPHGSIWITGGSVGPEGSILAFIAVLTALGLLVCTTRQGAGA
jgi:membrane protease YdiL (CAAX protease family)